MKRSKWLMIYLVIMVFIAGAFFALRHSDYNAFAVDDELPCIDWREGQGVGEDSCHMSDENRTAAGWIHWIFTGSGGVTFARLELSGSGSGTYFPYDEYGHGSLHFFSPYFDTGDLHAKVCYEGEVGTNPQLTISDYCPGEQLDVSKTVDTSFTRTYLWDITKEVETENGYEHEGYPKIWLPTDGSGDETATWEVCVIYDGYEDSDHNVSGTITIENVGEFDAEITGIEDILGGVPITPECGVAFPYLLLEGGTLTCTYTYDGYVEGSNEVTVTTAVTKEYSASAAIVWGEPDTEVNKTVNVKDISDLFGEVDLGTVTAPDGGCFTYDKHFAYEDYEECGDYTYTNTASIEETGQSASATLKVNVPCLTACVTTDPSLICRYAWTIDKSVTPEAWNLFRGDSGTSQYTITVTKGECSYEAYITGQICITNEGDVATQDLEIVIELRDGVGPPNDLINTAEVDVSGHPVLGAGETHCYDYHIDIPPGDLHPGEEYEITANITISNSGDLGDPPKPTDTTTLPTEPTETVDDTINVDDSYDAGDFGPVSESTSVTYVRTFECDADEGTIDNTATIVETEQSDDASVTVTCYALEVSKTAETSYDRTYEWTIDKTGSTDEVTLAIGQQYQVDYDVCVNILGITDSDWAVTGEVSVHNPAPIDAEIVDVTDDVNGTSADVDCGVTFPYDLVTGGEDLDCDYSADLTSADPKTNTATATLQNYDYGYDGSKTASGTTVFSGEAAVTFGDPTNLIDECVDVSDTNVGTLGAVCYDDTLPKCFDYSLWIGPYELCGEYDVPNTASFVTNDTATTGADSWNVDVHVPCEVGCTRTPGYWKNHSSEGPAPYDDTWALLGESTTFFLSGQSYLEVIRTKPGTSAYYQLAFHYIAAVLNQLSGASVPPEVQTAIDQATVKFETFAPDDLLDGYAGKSGKKKKLKNGLADEFLALKNKLAAYNEGYTGPGHCDEDKYSMPER